MTIHTPIPLQSHSSHPDVIIQPVSHASIGIATNASGPAVEEDDDDIDFDMFIARTRQASDVLMCDVESRGKKRCGVTWEK